MNDYSLMMKQYQNEYSTEKKYSSPRKIFGTKILEGVKIKSGAKKDTTNSAERFEPIMMGKKITGDSPNQSI